MGTPAVNFSGQTERPWEVTIRLSYNFLPLKPMLKSSSKRVGALLKSGIFNTNEMTAGRGCRGWGWTATVVLSGKFGGKGEKSTFENLGDFLKTWDDERSRLSRIGMNGNSRSVREICREKVKIPPSFWNNSCVQYQQARLGHSTLNTGSVSLKRSSAAVLVTRGAPPHPSNQGCAFYANSCKLHVSPSGSGDCHPAHLPFASLDYMYVEWSKELQLEWRFQWRVAKGRWSLAKPYYSRCPFLIKL